MKPHEPVVGGRTLLLDFLIEELQKDEIIHWEKSMGPGTFSMSEDAHTEIARRWGEKKPQRHKEPNEL